MSDIVGSVIVIVFFDFTEPTSGMQYRFVFFMQMHIIKMYLFTDASIKLE